MRQVAFRNWRSAYFAKNSTWSAIHRVQAWRRAVYVQNVGSFCSWSSDRGKPASRHHFVSEHFRLEQGEVESYLRGRKISFRLVEEHAIVEECPFCPPTKKETTNLFKLYVLLASGVYICHRCKNKGTWFDLRKRVGGYGRTLLNPFCGTGIESSDSSSASGGGQLEGVAFPTSEKQYAYVQDLWEKHDAARLFLTENRGLKEDVLKKYGVGAGEFQIMDKGRWNRHICITFPMYDGNGQLVRHKIRSIQAKSGMRLDPKGGGWGMFGLDMVPNDADDVVITEGEFDALSVFQGTGRPAISLPNGASSLPIALLPPLEKFKKIHLWMDDDAAGHAGAKQFSRKLGIARCKSVNGMGCKDANDALREKKDMREMINKSRAVPHEGLLRFEDIREDVRLELANVETNKGVKCLSLPRMNDLLKGHRRGELTILSGHTGSGKTTILSQLALDYCIQGVPTLWGSFEIGNVKLAGRLVRQLHAAYGATGDLVSEFESWADRFSELPMYFMKYHGSEDVDKVIETMEYANYVYDCSHVVLDNLQFMTSGQGEGNDRFAVLDKAVGKLREFATVRNTHISLVVHPRKELDDDRIQTASVFGSAKATQEADNVVILQKGQEGVGPMLDIRKNRYDGDLGTISLRFDRKRLIYSQLDHDSSSFGWMAKDKVKEKKKKMKSGKWEKAIEKYQETDRKRMVKKKM